VSRRNRRCGVSNNVKGCDGEAPNFLGCLGDLVLVSLGDSMCARVIRRLKMVCV
jgi:hypothetical protein